MICLPVDTLFRSRAFANARHRRAKTSRRQCVTASMRRLNADGGLNIFTSPTRRSRKMKTGVVQAVAAALFLTVAAIAASPTASTRIIMAKPTSERDVQTGTDGLLIASRAAAGSVPGLHSGLK
jgi:hypothetical protein